MTELLEAAFIDEVVSGTLGAALERAGFGRVRGRTWVRSGPPPVRHMVMLNALKGAAYSPAWGVSLDYVPHVAGRGTVKWHRTDKSARLDLTYDTADYEGDREWQLRAFSSAHEFSGQCRAMAPRLVRAVEDFVAPLTSVVAIREAFEAMRKRPTTRFGFENYDQNVLAYAFTLARLDETADAEAWLTRYLDANDPDDDEIAATLRRLLAEAASHAAGS